MTPIAEAPEWLLALFAAKAAKAQSPRPAPEFVDASWAVEYARREIESGVGEWAPAVDGNRNDKAYGRSCRLFEIGVPEAEAVELLARYLGLGAPPDEGPHECAEHFVERVYNPSSERGAIAAFGSGLPPKPPGTASEIREAVRLQWAVEHPWEEPAPMPEPKPATGRFTRRSAADLIALPPIEFYDADKMLPKGAATGTLFGYSGTFKTGWIIVKIGELISQGVRVAYLLGEGDRDFGARLRAYYRRYKCEPFPHDLFMETQVPFLLSPDDMAGFYALLDGFQPQVIFGDTLSTAAAGAKLDEQIGFLFTGSGVLGQLAAKYDALVLFVHHTGWEGKHEKGDSGVRDNASVSIAFEANVNVVEMESPVTHISVHARKMKGGAASHRRYFAVEYEPIEGAPVLMPCSHIEWALHLEKKNQNAEDAALGFKAISAALHALQAFDAASQQPAIGIVRHLMPQRDTPAKEYGESCQRIAAKLEERARTDLAGLSHRDSNGRLLWYSTPS